jgi:hypothetical protein
LGGTTDINSVRPIWDERCIFLIFAEGENMNTMPKVEPQEINLQERALEMPTDHSLPAAQVIEEQDTDAAQNNAPRFIP